MSGAADRCYVGRSAVHDAPNPYLVIVDVNTDIENLKNAVVKVLFSPLLPTTRSALTSPTQMVQAGHPVFFGCDVGQFSDSARGVMDTALFEYEV